MCECYLASHESRVTSHDKMNQTQAQRRLAELQMDDMLIVQIAALSRAAAPDWFVKYKALRRAFMKSLSDSIEELSFLSINREEFVALLSGEELPEGLSLRLRIPLVYGGELEISNMFMCKTFPFSNNMDIFIMEQSGSAEIWLPNPAKKIYIPAHMLGGGAGGNATDDRLSQMSAQFAAAERKGMDM